MTVLHIAESFSSGVASAIHACLEAQPANVEAAVYGYRIPGVQLEDRVELPVPFFELPSGKLQQLRAIRSVVADRRPDVLHLHSSWAGLFGRIVPVPRSTRIVFTPHCWGFQRLDLSDAKRAAVLGLDKLMGLRTDVVLACGVREAELAEEFRLGRTVLHLPQRLPSHLRQEIGSLHRRRSQRGQQLTVAMSGRLCPQKGVDFYASVARGLRATPEGRDGLHMKWIGGGPADAVAELHAAGVEVTGWLTQAESVRELAASDVYLHTASWEGYPMTILEAIELQLPVVARAIPALVAEPRGVQLVSDPAAAISELLKMLANWPVSVPAQPPVVHDERKRVMAIAYSSQASTTSSSGPGSPGSQVSIPESPHK